MGKGTYSARHVAVGGGVLVVAGLMMWVRFTASSVEEGSGTITSLDVAGRHASIEIINPSTGKTLQYEGEVPPECEITINGKAAALTDLHKGDVVRVRALLERRARTPGGKKKPHWTSQLIAVTRDDSTATTKK